MLYQTCWKHQEILNSNNTMSSISLLQDCVMLTFNEDVMHKCMSFSCGDEDLNSFFMEDAFLYAEEMLGKTYCWVTKSKPYRIVALITLANDSIKAHKLESSSRNRLQRNISNAKRGRSYPAVLIGRIGVNEEYQGMHIGSQLLDFVKAWFCHKDNKTGCRFVVVDAYNKLGVLNFYSNNGFKFLFKTEDDEKLYYEVDDNSIIHIRLMYFDLKSK